MPKASSPPPSALGLRRVKLFEGLPIPRLEELARQCRWRRFVPDEHIISRKAPDTDVYFLISGRVSAKAFSASGRQVTFREIAAGDWFGDFAAIDGLTRSADIIAVEETLVAAMSPALFLRTLHENVEVCDRMLRRLVGTVRDLTERIYDFSTLGVQNRLHAEILRLAREAGVEGNRARIEPAPKHTDIAGQISTYREQVTRELSVMAKSGLVEKSGRALVVPDVAKLQRIVEEVRRST
jgi:CRP-like cAMP-binding protein